MKIKRLVFFACFAAAFLAGIALHAAMSRSACKERHGFAAELGLAGEKADEFEAIWASAFKKSHKAGRDGHDEIRAAREKAIIELLPEDRRARYDEILDEEKAAFDALDKKRRTYFDDAVEETKKLLSDEQRALYEKLLAEREAKRQAKDKERNKPMENPQ